MEENFATPGSFLPRPRTKISTRPQNQNFLRPSQSSAMNAARKSKRKSIGLLSGKINSIPSPVRPSLPAIPRGGKLPEGRRRVGGNVSSGYGMASSSGYGRAPMRQNQPVARPIGATPSIRVSGASAEPRRGMKRQDSASGSRERLSGTVEVKKQRASSQRDMNQNEEEILEIKERLAFLESTRAEAEKKPEPVVITQPVVDTKLIEEHQRQIRTYVTRIGDLEDSLSKKEAELLEKDKENSRVSSELNMEKMESQSLRSRLQAKFEETVSLQTQLSGSETQIRAVQTDLTEMKNRVEALDGKLGAANETIRQLQETIAERDKELGVKESIVRRQHQDIQNLKGSIRVCCRLRPLIPGEDGRKTLVDPAVDDSRCSSESETPALRIDFPDKDGESKELVVEGATTTSTMEWAKKAKNVRKCYEFEKVFPPDRTQEDIFEELRDLILSALHGYNVTVFAYGQTGSGKTHTMEGGPDPEEVARNPDCPNAGIIPRAVQLLFREKEKLIKLGWMTEFYVSFLEIYNEEPQDLIPKGAQSKKAQPVKIRFIKDDVVVEDLTPHKAENPSQVFELLQRGLRLRSVAATKLNQHSSRSHAIFRITISAENRKEGSKTESVLSLVDLAGSENLKESEATGDRKTETAHINTSLHTLKKVIAAQAEANTKQGKPSVIPYRESQLTMLLKNALGGGSSKTLMIATVSPFVDNLDETKRTLEFASQASKCKIGVAQKNTGR